MSGKSCLIIAEAEFTCLSVSIFPDLRISISVSLTSTETCRVGCVFLLFLDGVVGNPVEKEKVKRAQYTPEID